MVDDWVTVLKLVVVLLLAASSLVAYTCGAVVAMPLVVTVLCLAVGAATLARAAADKEG